MSNNDGGGGWAFFFFFLLLGLGIYEYTISDPSMLMFEGSLEAYEGEEISYFGAIKFNVEASQGKVLSLSGLNNVVKELNECSVFDDENWTCRDYYLGETIGKIDNEWITPDWLRPVTYDLEWLYLKYFWHHREHSPKPLFFSQTVFEPAIEIYTSTDQAILNLVGAARDRVAGAGPEEAIEDWSDEQLNEVIDAYEELYKLYDRMVIESEQVSRLPLADGKRYGWRIRLLSQSPLVSVTRTEQTNQANSQSCYVDEPPEEYCVFQGLAEIARGEDGAQYISDGYVTDLDDPPGIYKYRVFIDGMYQGEAEAEFYSP